jgi:Protein of unknown function (DUF1579)
VKPTLALIAIVLAIYGCNVGGQEDQHVQIEQALAKLQPMVGSWSTLWKFHRDAEIIERVGTDSISAVLGQTYFEWQIERHPKEDPARSQTSVIYTTFDPRLRQYVMTHFYKGSSLRVTATGDYDEASHQLRTKAFIPLEDGVRDENVRAIIDLSKRDRVVYTHFSRFNDESAERMDLEIVLTRR